MADDRLDVKTAPAVLQGKVVKVLPNKIKIDCRGRTHDYEASQLNIAKLKQFLDLSGHLSTLVRTGDIFNVKQAKEHCYLTLEAVFRPDDSEQLAIICMTLDWAAIGVIGGSTPVYIDTEVVKDPSILEVGDRTLVRVRKLPRPKVAQGVELHWKAIALKVIDEACTIDESGASRYLIGVDDKNEPAALGFVSRLKKAGQKKEGDTGATGSTSTSPGSNGSESVSISGIRGGEGKIYQGVGVVGFLNGNGGAGSIYSPTYKCRIFFRNEDFEGKNFLASFTAAQFVEFIAYELPAEQKTCGCELRATYVQPYFGKLPFAPLKCGVILCKGKVAHVQENRALFHTKELGTVFVTKAECPDFVDTLSRLFQMDKEFNLAVTEYVGKGDSQRACRYRVLFLVDIQMKSEIMHRPPTARFSAQTIFGPITIPPQKLAASTVGGSKCLPPSTCTLPTGGTTGGDQIFTEEDERAFFEDIETEVNSFGAIGDGRGTRLPAANSSLSHDSVSTLDTFSDTEDEWGSAAKSPGWHNGHIQNGSCRGASTHLDFAITPPHESLQPGCNVTGKMLKSCTTQTENNVSPRDKNALLLEKLLSNPRVLGVIFKEFPNEISEFIGEQTRLR